MPNGSSRTAVLAMWLAAGASPAFAQNRGMMGMQGPLQIPRAREASGTAWLPNASPMYAIHSDAGAWQLMLHHNVFLQYITEGSDRGASQLGSVNWLMGMARRPLAGGELGLRAMLSLEPLTVGSCGYPDLLATGEFCEALGPIHDRQHPHDLFMDLSAMYEWAVSSSAAFQLYAGVAGEPALGPVAYPHRLSALPNLLAPISHHWMDATHIAFGVVTAGFYGLRWKVESSMFNGREPDEQRYDIDLDRLDSFSGRVWFLPTDHWAFQLSVGHLKEAELHEAGEPRIDVTRATASATYHRPLAPEGLWATTLVWGRNQEEGDEPATNAVLIESSLNLRERDVLFGRIEAVEKTGHDLVLAGVEDRFTVGKITLGYSRQLGPAFGLVPAVGASLSAAVVPANLQPFYGTTVSPGLAIFGRLSPRPSGIQPHSMQQHDSIHHHAASRYR